MFLFRRKQKPAPVSPSADDPFLTPASDPSMFGKLVNGALPAGWLEYHRAFLLPRDELLLQLSELCAQELDSASAIALHRQCIDAYTQYRAECQDRGECFRYYFEAQYHDSDAEHGFIAPYRAQLDRLLHAQLPCVHTDAD